jgi:hypothetical protein
VLDVAGRVRGQPDLLGESLARLVRGETRRRDYSFGLSQNTDSAFVVRGGYKFIAPPAILPHWAARAHLAPMSPPTIGVDHSIEYEIGPEGDRQVLRYDFDADPLGMADMLPETPQLYDRRADPEERDNLYQDEPERVQLMTTTLETLVRRSSAVREAFGGEQDRDPHSAQDVAALAELGYIAAVSEDDAGAEAPAPNARKLREMLEDPWLPPDVTQLTEGDRQLHLLRLQLREGGVSKEVAARRFAEIGDTYVDWLRGHADLMPRVAWRIRAIADLGRAHGIPVEIERWGRALAEHIANQEEREAETDAPGR